MLVQVKEYPTATFELQEDGVWRCNHEEAYIEPACCSGRDSEGNPSCACHGVDGIICPAIDCTDIQEWEIEALYDSLRSWPDE